MIDKDQLCESICMDFEICKHLYTKLPAGSLDYRPTPGQRSTLELLQYIAAVGKGFFDYMLADDIAVIRAATETGKLLKAEDFPAAIDAQNAALRAGFASITQETFETQLCTMPWAETLTLEQATLANLCKWAPAYKMQLFLYAKSCGAEIGTPNIWMGMDMPARP